MPRFGVRPEKEIALEARLRKLKILEEDLEERFVRSAGPGGQKVNKTSTCVYLKHRPTGIEVKVQEARSQALNRFLARRILADRIEEKSLSAPSPREQVRDKIRRRKERRARRSKRKSEASAE